MPAVPGFRTVLAAFALVIVLVLSGPVAAQDDASATSPPVSAPPPPPVPASGEPPRERINILVTVPRGEVNQAQAAECEDRADAGAISGEIVVCRRIGDDGSNALSDSRKAAQKRYAQETAFANSPQAPDVAGAGIFQGPATISGQCFIPPCPPPPALLIDVAALPKAPAGSDADRIANGLPPLGQEAELSEEQEKARREAAGIKTAVPARPKKKGG